MSDDHQKSEWQKNIEKLNSRPEFQLFEVGQSGVVLGGDIELSKGDDDEFEAQITGVKPGIWHVVLTYTKDPNQIMDEFQHAVARWVAPGPLNVETLSTGFPEPDLAPLSGWEKVGSYSVDSGCHGLIDEDGLATLVEREGGDREYVLENCADLSHEVDNQVSAQIGFVIGGDDGGYNLWAKTHQGQKVELMVKPNFAEDEDGEEQEDEDDDE